MDEALQKIKELVYRMAEQVAGAPVEDVLNQERFLTLYIQLKMLDTLLAIADRLSAIESELVRMNPLYS